MPQSFRPACVSRSRNCTNSAEVSDIPAKEVINGFGIPDGLSFTRTNRKTCSFHVGPSRCSPSMTNAGINISLRFSIISAVKSCPSKAKCAALKASTNHCRVHDAWCESIEESSIFVIPKKYEMTPKRDRVNATPIAKRYAIQLEYSAIHCGVPEMVVS